MKFRFKEQRNQRLAPFGAIVSSLVKEFNLEEFYFIEELRRDWTSIVGQLLATHSIPNRVYKGILFIDVDDPTFANEISMIKGSILKRLHDIYNENAIRNIKFEIRRLSWKKK